MRIARKTVGHGNGSASAGNMVVEFLQYVMLFEGMLTGRYHQERIPERAMNEHHHLRGRGGGGSAKKTTTEKWPSDIAIGFKQTQYTFIRHLSA